MCFGPELVGEWRERERSFLKMSFDISKTDRSRHHGKKLECVVLPRTYVKESSFSNCTWKKVPSSF